jgi:hypothetical protein
MNILLDNDDEIGHDPVKIAILDTGITGPYYQYIADYKDFVTGMDDEPIDNTHHGTNGVHLTLQIIPNAKIYVARVFEDDKANKKTPSLLAEVC